MNAKGEYPLIFYYMIKDLLVAAQIYKHLNRECLKEPLEVI